MPKESLFDIDVRILSWKLYSQIRVQFSKFAICTMLFLMYQACDVIVVLQEKMQIL